MFLLLDLIVVAYRYLSSSHGTASDAEHWMLHMLLMAITTSYLEESAPALEFPVSHCSSGFLQILVTKFAACSKPPPAKQR